jgi:hypothetical protein
MTPLGLPDVFLHSQAGCCWQGNDWSSSTLTPRSHGAGFCHRGRHIRCDALPGPLSCNGIPRTIHSLLICCSKLVELTNCSHDVTRSRVFPLNTFLSFVHNGPLVCDAVSPEDGRSSETSVCTCKSTRHHNRHDRHRRLRR